MDDDTGEPDTLAVIVSDVCDPAFWGHICIPLAAIRAAVAEEEAEGWGLPWAEPLPDLVTDTAEAAAFRGIFA